MFYIKISAHNSVTGVHHFKTELERTRWLLKHGFVDGRDVYYHPFSKEVAGLFTCLLGQKVEEADGYRTCDMRFRGGSKTWRII